MPVPLRVLIAEDSHADTELLLLELSRGGFGTASKRVETAEEMRVALAEAEWDLVNSDHSMPGFGPWTLSPFVERPIPKLRSSSCRERWVRSRRSR